jgi:hypothetical protein
MGFGNNCSSLDGDGQCGPQLPQINQGTASSEQKVLQVTLVDRVTKQPIDLTLVSAIMAVFPATNTQGYITKSLGTGIAVVTPGTLGLAQVTLAGSDVALLTPGVISFTVYVTTPNVTNGIAQFLNALQVNGPPFPGA